MTHHQDVVASWFAYAEVMAEAACPQLASANFIVGYVASEFDPELVDGDAYCPLSRHRIINLGDSKCPG